MTYAIIAITVLFSALAFSNRELMFRYNLNPYSIIYRKQWYRVLTHAFLHANWLHLIVNMFVLYSFGKNGVEPYMEWMERNGFIGSTTLHFGILYIAGIIVSVITTLRKHKKDYAYNAVGASGAVSAVVFFCIFFDPWNLIYFFGIIPIPSIIFGALYLFYSQYMSRQEKDNINHDAHFLGALFGLSYPILIHPKLLIIIFFDQLMNFPW